MPPSDDEIRKHGQEILNLVFGAACPSSQSTEPLDSSLIGRPTDKEITVEARRIIAMSESISILDAWKVSDKKTIRESEGTDYGLVLKANICGGLIYISDFSQTPPPARKKK